MNVTARIQTGIKTRLSYVIPYLEKWPQAMYLGIDPRNLSNTAQHIHKISDEIWFQAGDRSLDVSFNHKLILNIFLVFMVHKTWLIIIIVCIY